jgi:RNA polymerase sigma factor (sigma-70 family)
MTDGLKTVVRRLRQLTGREGETASDTELLRRYIVAGDEVAFELLLWRHGPMVLGVCRRLLRHSQDAEDAFQATFLTLVRKARSIGRGEALAGWLYRVAYRVALRARDVAVRRPVPLPEEAEPATTETASTVEEREMHRVLDEELNRLPQSYQTLIVLCYFQGKTHDEAAQLLGCPRGTVAARLHRARQRLHIQLTRRGVSLSATALVMALSAGAAQAASSSALMTATLQTVSSGISTGTVSASVAALAKGVVTSMVMGKVQLVLLLLAGLTLGIAGGYGTARVLAQPAEAVAEADSSRKERPTKEEKDDLFSAISQLDGKLLFVGTEFKPGEHVPDGEELTKQLAAGKVYKHHRLYLAVQIPENDPTPKAERIIVRGDAGQTLLYRRWREEDELSPGRLRVFRETVIYHRLERGDRVKRGDLLALVNPALITDELLVKVAKLDLALADKLAAENMRDEAERLWRRDLQLYNPGKKFIPEDELRANELAWHRACEDAKAKAAAMAVAKMELHVALTMLKFHEIRSPVVGVVKELVKKSGDAVRHLDVVARIRPSPPR